MATADDYTRVVNAAQATGQVGQNDQQIARTLQNEQSPRGRAFREAMGTSTRGDNWGW